MWSQVNLLFFIAILLTSALSPIRTTPAKPTCKEFASQLCLEEDVIAAYGDQCLSKAEFRCSEYGIKVLDVDGKRLHDICYEAEVYEEIEVCFPECETVGTRNIFSFCVLIYRVVQKKTYYF